MRVALSAVTVLLVGVVAWFALSETRATPAVDVVTPRVDVIGSDAVEPPEAPLAAGEDGKAHVLSELPESSTSAGAALSERAPHGVVVDDEGRPIEGATIARSATFDVLATTRADGTFALSAPLADGEALLVRHSHHRQGIHRPTSAQRAATAPMRITLISGARLILRVVDVHGRPVPSALVAWIDGDNLRIPYGEETIAERYELLAHLAHSGHVPASVLTLTDDDGRAVLAGITTEYGACLIDSDEFPRHIVPAITMPLSGDVDIGAVTLPAGVTLRGRVSDERAVPIAGAQVEVANDAIWRSRTGVSDAGGNFAIPRLPGAYEYALVVTHRDYSTAEQGPVTPDEFLEVTLPSRLDLLLRVIDGPSGQPITREMLALLSAQRPPTSLEVDVQTEWSVTPDASGLVAIPGIDRLGWTLALQCEGYRHVLFDVPTKASSTEPELVELWPAVDMRLRVVDGATGAGVEGANFKVTQVIEKGDGKTFHYRRVHARPGATSGDYLLDPNTLPTSGELLLFASVEGFEADPLSFGARSAFPDEHDFTLVPDLSSESRQR